MTGAWRQKVLVAVLTLAAAGCGEDDLTGPIPEIAGEYAGSFSIRFLQNPQISQGSMRVNIEQSGEQVTISGSMIAFDQTVPISGISGTLDSLGFLELTTDGFFASADAELCGNVRTLTSTMTFSGRGAAQVDEHADTDFCGRLVLSGLLTRQ